MVLAGLLQHGKEFFFEIENKLDEFCFEPSIYNDNPIIFRCLYETAKEYSVVNYSTVILCAENLGMSSIINKGENIETLTVLAKNQVQLEDAVKASHQLRKKSLAKQLKIALEQAASDLSLYTGMEPLSEILSTPADAVSSVLDKVEDDDRPVKLFSNIVEYLTYLRNNPREIIGLPTPHPIYNEIIGGGLRPGCVNFVVARPKALRYGSKVYTENGPKNIEDIKVGDTVKHPFKGDTIVTHVWDHYNKDIYRVYFRDGDFVDCCEDHVWHVNKRYGKKKEFLKTTKELLNDITFGNNNTYKWDIPLPEPVSYMEQDVPIDPYALGVILGDGSVSNNNCYSKFIPKNYIYNSTAVRLAILAGLLDTNGDCTIDKRSKQSRTRFTSVSYQLCLDVKEIVHSLGGLCSINNNKTKLNGKIFHSYRCEIRLPKGINPFRLNRKRDNFTERILGNLKRTIVKIEKVDVDNARCLTLSDNDGLFMTDNYVVTHNCGKSTFAKNTGLFLSSEYNVPCLYLDTEMGKEDQQHRGVAEYTGTSLKDVERGLFDENVIAEMSHIQNIPFYHKRVPGMAFEEIISICNRWVKTEVGRDETGKIKDCLIIYDYFKLMNPEHKKDMKEYEAIGHQLDKLKTFVNINQVSCLTFTQSNRDDDVSQSDRISWFASSVCFLEKKTQEEIIADGGPKNGNIKIRSKFCRYGGGLEEGDYISLNFDGDKSTMREINTRYNLQIRSAAPFEYDDSETDEEDS